MLDNTGPLLQWVRAAAEARTHKAASNNIVADQIYQLLSYGALRITHKKQNKSPLTNFSPSRQSHTSTPSTISKIIALKALLSIRALPNVHWFNAASNPINKVAKFAPESCHRDKNNGISLLLESASETCGIITWKDKMMISSWHDSTKAQLQQKNKIFEPRWKWRFLWWTVAHIQNKKNAHST